MPECAEVTETNGNEVTVRLYDMRGTDKKILNELTIDCVTRKGKQLFDGASFQLANNQSPNEPLWEPVSSVYQLVPDGKAAAVIYLGTYKHPTETIDVESIVKYYAEHSDAAKKYTFIKDIPEQNIVWTDNGTELWVILPKNSASTITVWEKSPETHTAKHRLTETYNGAPIILCCNYSDIAPDVSVQINPIGGTPNAPFAPYISMKDGNPTTTDEENITVLN